LKSWLLVNCIVWKDGVVSRGIGEKGGNVREACSRNVGKIPTVCFKIGKKSFDEMAVLQDLTDTDFLLAFCKNGGKSLNVSPTRVFFDMSFELRVTHISLIV